MQASRKRTAAGGTMPRTRPAARPIDWSRKRRPIASSSTARVRGTATPRLTSQKPQYLALKGRVRVSTIAVARLEAVMAWPGAATVTAPDIHPGSSHGYWLPRAAEPWGASTSWIRRGAATTAATPAKSSQARRQRINARPAAMTATAKRLCTWMTGSSPTRRPATATSKSRARARSKTARSSTRDATTTSKPSIRVRWGSHQANSGVYHS